MTRQTAQYILGYLLGGVLTLVFIPLGLYRASRTFDHLIGLKLIPNARLRFTVAGSLALLGLLFGVWSNIVQHRVGQGGPLQIGNIDVSPKTQHLVVTGPYRNTRNPMLFGACVFYTAVAIGLNSVIALALVSLFTTFMLIFVKRSEEPRLLKDFGSDYEQYRQRVSLFVPWLPARPMPPRD
jgi:protein-S-isoprenylcysteine O-methyltransferase Ste14